MSMRLGKVFADDHHYTDKHKDLYRQTDKQTNIKICILFFRLLSIKFLADHLTKIMKQFIFCGFLNRSSTDPE